MARPTEQERLQLGRAIMESTLRQLGSIGVRVKARGFRLRADQLTYHALSSTGDPPARHWEKAWEHFRIVITPPDDEH